MTIYFVEIFWFPVGNTNNLKGKIAPCTYISLIPRKVKPKWLHLFAPFTKYCNSLFSNFLFSNKHELVLDCSYRKKNETYYRSARVRVLTSLNPFEWFCTISNHFPVISRSILIYLGVSPSISFYLGISSSVLLYHGLSSSILFYLWLYLAMSGYLWLSLAISGYLYQSLTFSGNFW